MTPADLHLTAQLVAAGRVHCVSDEAVMAMARRVLELEVALARTEQDVAFEASSEREACAKVCERLSDESNQPSFPFDCCALAIRARGAK